MTLGTPSQIGPYPQISNLAFGATFAPGDEGRAYFASVLGIVAALPNINADSPGSNYLVGQASVISTFAWYMAGFANPGEHTTMQILIDGLVAREFVVESEAGDVFGVTVFEPLKVPSGSRVCLVWIGGGVDDIEPGVTTGFLS